MSIYKIFKVTVVPGRPDLDLFGEVGVRPSIEAAMQAAESDAGGAGRVTGWQPYNGGEIHRSLPRQGVCYQIQRDT